MISIVRARAGMQLKPRVRKATRYTLIVIVHLLADAPSLLGQVRKCSTY